MGDPAGQYALVPSTDPGGSPAEEVVKKPQSCQSDLEGFQNIIGQNKVLSSMLISVPLGLLAPSWGWPQEAIFLSNFIGIIPLAWLIGKSTEDLSASVGETVGGLLNATFGNVVEMLLCVSGIRTGEIVVVQCTLLGSILSNMLLVLGCSFFCGGLYYKLQGFSQAGANCQCSLMVMAVFAIGLPTIYANLLRQEEEWNHMVQISRVSSVLLLFVYGAYLFFQLKTHADIFEGEGGGEEEEEPDLSPLTSGVLLAFCTVVTSQATDALMASIEGTVESWQLSQEFVGIIMLPIIGNAAEHYTAITVAMRNKMDLSIGVAVGSSCQMALLVTPVTVLFGWVYGQEMTLDFHSFQFVVLLLSVFLVAGIVNNGTSNWLEGLMLLVAYILLAVVYLFEGTGREASLAIQF